MLVYVRLYIRKICVWMLDLLYMPFDIRKGYLRTVKRSVHRICYLERMCDVAKRCVEAF